MPTKYPNFRPYCRRRGINSPNQGNVNYNSTYIRLNSDGRMINKSQKSGLNTRRKEM